MDCSPALRHSVCDASVVINFLLAGRLDLLVAHPEYRFVLTQHVRAEITVPAQRSALESAIAKGEIEEVPLDEPAALAVFAELTAVLGSGESAAIALAVQHRWIVAMDDRQARREAERRLGPGRIVTTPGVLLGCIQRGVLTVVEADAIKAVLAANRFEMPFETFADELAKRKGT